jgi:hypothetical protein
MVTHCDSAYIVYLPNSRLLKDKISTRLVNKQVGKVTDDKIIGSENNTICLSLTLEREDQGEHFLTKLGKF